MDPKNPSFTSEDAAPLRPIPRQGLRPSAAAVLYLLLFLAALALGVGVNRVSFDFPLPPLVAELICGISLLAIIIYLWRVCRSKGTPIILTLLTGFCFFTTGSLAMAAVPTALLFLIGIGGAALSVMPRKQGLWMPLIPLAAYAATAILGRDLILSLVVFVPFPAMLILSWATRRAAAREDGPNRVGVICLVSLTLGLTLTALTAALLYRWLGSLEPSLLGQALEDLREALIGYITTREIPEDLADSEALRELFSRESATYLVNSFFNLAIGYAVAGVNILAAVAQLIQLDALAAFGAEDSLCDRVRVFRMSLVSGLVFVLAYIVAIIADAEQSTLAGAVAQNIYAILLPGLAFAGLLRLTALLSRRGMGGMGCLFYFIIFVPCLLFVAPPILAVFEVAGHIASLIRNSLKPPDDDDPFRHDPPHD